MNWEHKIFNNLTADEVYSILKLRQEVFVVEQNCPYLDCDDYDQESLHLIGKSNNDIIVYARILPPGLYYPEVSVGRVVTHPTKRGLGLGREAMVRAMNIVEMEYGKISIRIMAQTYLSKFYQSFNFEMSGVEFLEDGIPHIEMIRL